MKRNLRWLLIGLLPIGVAVALFLAFGGGDEPVSPATGTGQPQPEKALPTPPGMEQILHFPEEVIFWNVAKGEERTADIYLRQNDDFPAEVTEIRSTAEQVQVKVIKSGGKEHRVYTLRATLDRKAAPGIAQGLILIKTNHPKKPEISIPVFWNVLDGLKIDPPAFGVQLTHTRRKAGGVIEIAATQKQPFAIEQIETALPGVRTDFKPMKPCCGYYIAVLVDDSKYEIKGPVQSSLVVYTNLKEMGKIIIPVSIVAPVLDMPEPEKREEK